MRHIAEVKNVELESCGVQKVRNYPIPIKMM